MATPESQGGLDYQDGGFASGSNIYAIVSDLAEQVARLGYYPGIDRSGNVVLYDDFSCGIDATELETGVLGETARLSGSCSKFGGWTVLLGRVANVLSYAGVHDKTIAREYNRVGAEVLFTPTTADSNIKLFIHQYNGTSYDLWGLRWDATTHKIYIGGDTGGWTEIASNYKCQRYFGLQHSMKLVVDTVTDDYVRVLIDGVSIDVVDIDPYSAASNLGQHIDVFFVNGYSAAVVSYLYVDLVMITTNEY